MTILAAMCLFALTMSISPGPVNVVTMSMGVNYGFKNTLPFITGAVTGFTVLLALIGFGIGQVAAENEDVIMALTYAGTTFIIYMGYKIATSEPKLRTSDKGKPGFFHGALMQWLNPKAWIASVAGVSAFNLVDDKMGLVIFVTQYFIVCYFSVSTWGFAGAKISSLLNDEARFRIFNIIMGGGLILVALYLLFMQISGG